MYDVKHNNELKCIIQAINRILVDWLTNIHAYVILVSQCPTYYPICVTLITDLVFSIKQFVENFIKTSKDIYCIWYKQLNVKQDYGDNIRL